MLPSIAPNCNFEQGQVIAMESKLIAALSATCLACLISQQAQADLIGNGTNTVSALLYISASAVPAFKVPSGPRTETDYRKLNLEAVSQHAYPSLAATPLACDHDYGDRRRDRMRGPRDAPQRAAAPDRDGDGTGRQRLRGGRQALQGGAREGRRGGATSLDRRFGGNRCAAARPPTRA